MNIQTYFDFLTLGFVANKNIIIILLFFTFLCFLNVITDSY